MDNTDDLTIPVCRRRTISGCLTESDCYPTPLIEQGGELGQDFVNDLCRHTFELSPAARVEVESARLVTANNAGGPRASVSERYCETANTGEIAAGRDRQHYRHLRQPIEGARRYDEHRPAALLLVALGRIERDQVDITALHQRSSLPTGRASSHSRSSSVGSAMGSHWASSSSSVYCRRWCGPTFKQPYRSEALDDISRHRMARNLHPVRKQRR